MRTLIIGERFNRAAIPRWTNLAWENPRRWLEMSLRMGCMGTGLSRKNGVGERKLRSIGLEWEAGFNLLPPDPTPGAWEKMSAAVVFHEYRRLYGVVAQTEKWIGGPIPPDFMFARWNADLLVFLGRRVEAAWGCQRTDYFEPRLTNNRGLYRITVPHPSGQNRWWNSESNRQTARAQVTAAYLTVRAHIEDDSGAAPQGDDGDRDGGGAPP